MAFLYVIYLPEFVICLSVCGAICNTINSLVIRVFRSVFSFGLRLLQFAQSTGSTSILFDWWTADLTVQILLIFNWQNTWSFSKEDSKFATIWFCDYRVTVASFSRYPVVLNRSREAIHPEFLGSYPQFQGGNQFEQALRTTTIGVSYARYSAHKPFARLAFSEATS